MQRQFDIDKFSNAILFFYENTDPGVLGKTKIFKLLFYSDFSHVRELGRPIIGDVYYHLPIGPVPTMAKDLLDIISYDHPNDTEFKEDTIKKLRKMIKIDVISSGNYTFFKIIGRKKCDKSYFSQSELDIMKKIAEKFYNTTGTRLSQLSHRDPAYKNTSDQEQIDYILAFGPDKDRDKVEYYNFWKKEHEEIDLILHGQPT